MLVDFLSGPAGLALAAAGGAFAARGVTYGLRALDAFVKGTPNKLDDRIFAAVTKALRSDAEGDMWDEPKD